VTCDHFSPPSSFTAPATGVADPDRDALLPLPSELPLLERDPDPDPDLDREALLDPLLEFGPGPPTGPPPLDALDLDLDLDLDLEREL
jgi:hypothetical protein